MPKDKPTKKRTTEDKTVTLTTNKPTKKRHTDDKTMTRTTNKLKDEPKPTLKCLRTISDTGYARRVDMLGRTRDVLFPGKGTESPPNGAH